MTEIEVSSEATANHDIVFLFSSKAEFLKVQVKDPKDLAHPVHKLLGKTVKEMTPGEEGIYLNKIITDTYESEEETIITYSFETIKGLQWFKGIGRAIRIEGVKYVLFTINNITELKTKIDNAQSATEEIQDILNNIPGVVFKATYDYKSQVFSLPYISDQFKSIIKVEDHNPKYLYSLINDEEKDSLKKAMNKAMVTQSKLHWKGTITDLERKEQHIAIQANCIEDDSTCSTWHGLVFNINDRIEAQNKVIMAKELEAKQARLESIGELAAGLGHEINNPLTIIYGYLKQLSKRIGEDETSETLIQKCVQATDRVRDIVSDLKGLHPDNHLKSRVKNIQMDKLIEETIQIFQSSYRKEGISLNYEAIDKYLWIQGDPARIQQILFHLLANAKKAIEESEKKVIIIRTKAIGSQFLSLEIEDTGRGIKDEHRTKIYDAFFTTFTNKTNKGLGLSVVSNIIKNHNGSIHFENNPDGEGLTFYLRFPLLRK